VDVKHIIIVKMCEKEINSSLKTKEKKKQQRK
jgi:hypothetical protein